MFNIEYYSHIEEFGDSNWKESLSDYIDRYQWMISKGYYA